MLAYCCVACNTSKQQNEKRFYDQQVMVVNEQGDTVRFTNGELRRHQDKNIDGLRLFYDVDGFLMLSSWQKNKQLHGLYTLYDEGVKKEEGMMIHNKREGMWLVYYPNGKVKEKGCYLNDEKFGHWESYDP